MPTTTIAGATVDTNDEGFFTDPDQWTEAMAPELAASADITELTDRHWQVLRFMRSEYAEKGTGPTVRLLGKASGVSVKELYQLFHPQEAVRAHQGGHRRQPRHAHGDHARWPPRHVRHRHAHAGEEDGGVRHPAHPPEFIEMIADTGACMYGCKASVDLFEMQKSDFIEQVQDIITVGEFYEIAAGGEIIFT